VVAGITAGVVLAAFQIIATAFLTGVDTATMPLRMTGAMLLGPHALEPGYSAAVALAAGLLVQMALSVACAWLFAALLSWLESVTEGEFLTTTVEHLLAGIVFGVAVWLVSFYLIAPLAGWTWFPTRFDHAVAFLGYGVLFGGWLGLVIDRMHAVHRRVA
jgi:hypothetical protein